MWATWSHSTSKGLVVLCGCAGVLLRPAHGSLPPGAGVEREGSRSGLKREVAVRRADLAASLLVGGNLRQPAPSVVGHCWRIGGPAADEASRAKKKPPGGPTGAQGLFREVCGGERRFSPYSAGARAASNLKAQIRETRNPPRRAGFPQEVRGYGPEACSFAEQPDSGAEITILGQRVRRRSHPGCHDVGRYGGCTDGMGIGLP